MSIVFGPQPGPQTAFMSSTADIVIYGGAAGGAKTYGLLLEAMRNIGNPNYGAVIFRKTYGEITNEGGIWDTSEKIYPHAGGFGIRSALQWRWSNGAKITFAHLQHEKYKFSWHGAQIPLLGFDELTHFSESSFFYLLSRNRSTCGVKPYIRATCNPDPDSWVAGFIEWWINQETGYPIPERSGVVRYFTRINDSIVWGDSQEDFPQELREAIKSVTFIASKLTDNKRLLDIDPNYLSTLKALPNVECERLLHGNWKIRSKAGDYFKRSMFPMVDASTMGGLAVRGWDRAATEPSSANKDPDWTCGVLLRQHPINGRYCIADVQKCRKGPGEVEQFIRNVAMQDGPEVIQVIPVDPGQAGKIEAAYLVRVLSGLIVETVIEERINKLARARPVASQAKAGNVDVVRASWNGSLFDELEQAGGVMHHDDQMDALSTGFNYLSNNMGNVAVSSI